MKQLLIIKSFLVLNILLIFNYCYSQNKMYVQDPEISNFNIIADYLVRGSGKWTGENPSHNPSNPRSPKAYGLWFDRPLKNLLTIKLVSYFNDTTLINSQGIFSRHPNKKQYIHISTDWRTGLSEGITEFPNDSTFISTMKNYRPNGNVFDHKDENFIVSENVHKNTSYKKDKDGNWVANGDWIWKRDPEK